MTTSNVTATGEIIITRVFDAPRELVWKAWTDPEHLMRWWGPEHFTSPSCQMDFRVGGKYIYAMRSPEGQDFFSTGVYQEIIPLERLVYTDSFSDADGNVISPTAYGLGDDVPMETLVEVTFEDLGGKTKMTLKNTGQPVNSLTDMAVMGWNQSLDKLAASLA